MIPIERARIEKEIQDENIIALDRAIQQLKTTISILEKEAECARGEASIVISNAADKIHDEILGEVGAVRGRLP